MTTNLVDIMATVEFHNIGIAPMTNSAHDMNRVLSTLSPEEARKMRRKFRKAWRKIRKKYMAMKGSARSAIKSYGEPGAVPTRTQKNNRKGVVMYNVMDKAKSIVSKMTLPKD